VPSTFGFDAPELDGARRLELWATYYSVPVVRASDRGVALRDRRGRALGPRLAPRDFCDAAMEGTVRIVDDDGAARTYDYAGTAHPPSADCTRWYPRHRAIGSSRFAASSKRFGAAARGGELVPYRTLAVDPSHIPLGTVLWIPAARGVEVRLPSGEVVTHDGYFYAADVGGAVRGNHVDVFLGLRGKNPFRFIQASTRATFEAYVVRDPELVAALAAEHGRPTRRGR
ncbi:hypothetical protein L6R52_18285, partial [Myxococcota bacterium]|nr:hypothetical protein [Myxococcota bacterium]